MNKRFSYILVAIILYLGVYFIMNGAYLENTTPFLLIPGLTLIFVFFITVAYWHGLKNSIKGVAQLLRDSSQTVDKVLLETLDQLLKSSLIIKVPFLSKPLLTASTITRKVSDSLLYNTADRLESMKHPLNILAMSVWAGLIFLAIAAVIGNPDLLIAVISFDILAMFFLVQTYDPLINLLNQFKLRRSVRPLALIQLYVWNWFLIWALLVIAGTVAYQTAMVGSHIFYLALLSYSATLAYHLKEGENKKGKKIFFSPFSDKGGYLLVANSAVLIAAIVISTFFYNTPLGRAAYDGIQSKLSKPYSRNAWVSTDTYYWEMDINKSDTLLVLVDVLKKGQKIRIPYYQKHQRFTAEVNPQDAKRKKKITTVLVYDGNNKPLYIPPDKLTLKNPSPPQSSPGPQQNDSLTTGSTGNVQNDIAKNKAGNEMPEKIEYLNGPKVIEAVDDDITVVPYLIRENQYFRIKTTSNSNFSIRIKNAGDEKERFKTRESGWRFKCTKFDDIVQLRSHVPGEKFIIFPS